MFVRDILQAFYFYQHAHFVRYSKLILSDEGSRKGPNPTSTSTPAPTGTPLPNFLIALEPRIETIDRPIISWYCEYSQPFNLSLGDFLDNYVIGGYIVKQINTSISAILICFIYEYYPSMHPFV
jgi:hypothetical protein